MKLFFVIILFVFLDCKSKTNIKEVDKGLSLSDRMYNDTLLLSGTQFIFKSYINCKTINDSSTLEETIFANSNIEVYLYDTITASNLKDRFFNQSLLKSCKLLNFEEDMFKSTNSEFTTRSCFVKDYGKCFIGQFYFPAASNSAQRRTTIITNLTKKEISIWNFDNVSVINDLFICEFNIRGKVNKITLKHSDTCNQFVVTSTGFSLP